MAATKILLVGASPTGSTRELEERLASLGYQVLDMPASGREALEVVERDRPDLVLMDIVLKGDMDGVETAAEIRSRFGTPVIYLTTCADEVILPGKDSQVTEPFGYLVKPFSDRELRANIEMALYKHQVDAKLMAVERWFATSMRQPEDGVIATDNEGRITFINQVAEVFTGWKNQEAIGKKLSEVLLLNCPTDAPVPGITEAVNGCLTLEVSGDVVLRNKRMDLEIPVYLVSCPGSTLHDGDGTGGGAVIVMRDLSEQRLAAGLLRKMDEQSKQSQKIDAARVMAGSIAHRFHNLISVILGQTLLLLNNPRLDAEFRDTLKQTRLAAEQAIGLTAQLLTISQSGASFRGRTEIVDLNRLVAGMEWEMSSYLGPGIALNAFLLPGLWKVKADPAQIKQVIRNLALNAKNAMPQGGNLTVETGNIPAEDLVGPAFEELTSGPYVTLTVEDAGCGMSREVQGRAFELFFTTQPVGNGDGLGLAMVYSIVKQNNGAITIDSEPGEGTSVRIYLPVAAEQEINEKKDTVSPPTDRVGHETVLVVEDEDMVRDLTCRVLQAQGYQVLEASRPEEAIGICGVHEGHIDLLVTDILLPGMDGGRLAELVSELIPSVKVLFVSGYPDHPAFSDGVLRGWSDYLQKPFSLDVLTHKVREVLDTPKFS